MEELSRNSFGSMHGLDSLLLAEPEKAPLYQKHQIIGKTKRWLPIHILVPWVLCCVMFVMLAFQSTRSIKPGSCFWSHYELGR